VAWRTDRVRFADVARLQERLECPEPLAWVLARRGLTDPDEARAFLASDGPLDPPEAIPGIPEAADRLAKAVRGGERIVVHGDYDCDGICSTAILVRALEARGARVRAFLPSRFTDGYGVSVATVERLADEGCDLLVTVDCGTTAVEALQRAADLGIESVVCDHHLAGGHRPPAIIANPALGRGTDALPAAAGVTFKLTQALAARLDADRLAPDPEEGLDLVALATVADAVPLVGENRRLVARGLAALRAQPRPGLAALCIAAGISPRAVDARGLGWSLAPAINASGRMAHPDRALQLLLAPDEAATHLLARELWELNMSRREVEQRVTQEAIQILDASPDEVRDASALVVAGEGWHEGVVGIVASRLVDRFGRPSIVVTIDGDTAKGSGRSLPGVDLHGLVAAASGTLSRWGGHSGAVGLQLASVDIPTFRVAFATAADSARAAIARARVRVVDAVVGIPDLTLPTAEAIETLQPFGAGNPEVRLVVPGCVVESAATMGEGGRHLQMRLRAGGAHTRALGWSMGERLPRIAVGDRHDVVMKLAVDRWQDLVGPRVTLEAIDELHAGDPLTGQCAQACDHGCPDRVSGLDARALMDPRAVVPEPPPGPPPIGIRDRRGAGMVVATLAALTGADRGVVAVVADAARRRAVLDDVLEPGRLGLEAAVIGGSRCAAAALAGRVAVAGERSLLLMVEYDVLPDIALPEGVHVALVDPPQDRVAATWALAAAAGRWLHLLWGDEEAAFAIAAAERELNVRPAAAEIWRGLGDGRGHGWGSDLDAILLGSGNPMRTPRAAAHALAALAEIGMVELSASGVRAVVGEPSGPLDDAPRAVACRERLGAIREFVSRSGTLTFDTPAISYEDVRAAG
jgi:single-stranded-DNA-specific exonuclease